MTHLEDLLRDALATRAASVEDDGLLHPVPGPRRSWAVRWRAPSPSRRPSPSWRAACWWVYAASPSTPPPARPGRPGRAYRAGVAAGRPHGPGGGARRCRVHPGRRRRRRGRRQGPAGDDPPLRPDPARFNVVATVNTYTSHLVAGEGHAAWWADRGDLDGPADRRRAPARRPPPGPSPGSLTGLAVADGLVTWSTLEAGIQSMRLSGGPVARMPGSAGYALMEWPWAGRAPDELVDLRTGTWSTAPTHGRAPSGSAVAPNGAPTCRRSGAPRRHAHPPPPRTPDQPVVGLAHRPPRAAGRRRRSGPRPSTTCPAAGPGRSSTAPEGVQLGDEATWYRQGDTLTVIDMDALR